MRAWVLVVSGCGRIAFDDLTGQDARRDDASVDARVCLSPGGHDEDADGIADACDGCPHIPDADQPDLDNDGVNDACDPRPSTRGDRITFFDPFVALDPGWFNLGIAVQFTGDDLVADARGSNRILMRRAHSSADRTFTLGGTIDAVDPANDRQLTLGSIEPDGGTFYCEIEGGDTTVKLAATYTFDAIAYSILRRSDGASLQPMPFVLTMRDANPTIGCASSWPVPEPSFMAILPDGLSAFRVGFGIGRAAVRLHYFVTIASE